MLSAIRSEIQSFSKSDRLFILFAMFCGFFICSEYSIIRPISNALFISSFGTQALPYAWLSIVPLNFCVVALYNKFLPRLGCFRMMIAIVSIVASVNLICATLLPHFPSLSFFFYVWKEVYVMLLFQQLWSVIHSTVSFKRAKYLYGIFFGIGGLGSTFASIIPGFFAVKMGSETLLFATVPIYLLLATCYWFALKNSKADLKPNENSSLTATLFHGIKLISASRYLIFIMSIVILMQLSSSLIEYLFNSFLETSVLHKDLRTEYIGKILGLMHGITIAMQFGGTFLLVHYLGIKRSHLAVPLMLCLNSIAFALFPLFSVISFAFISIKACDFSLFGIIKEMLYIPLKPEEKFQAKAFIDVFAYRSSKAFAALIILSLQTFFTGPLSTVLNWVGICLFASWVILVAQVLKPEQERVA